MRNYRYLSGLFVLLFYGAAPPALAQHPLDGLTVTELETIHRVLQQSGRLKDDARYAMVNLAEPAKTEVLRWSGDRPTVRRGLAVIRQQREVFEATVDLSTEQVLTWKPMPGVQPSLLDEEWLQSQAIVRSNSAWVAAIRKRGIRNIKQVFCFPSFGGYFDTARDRENRRLGMVACYDSASKFGLWGRPIAGLLAIVDYDEQKIIELIDTGVIPVPEGGPAISSKLPKAMPASGPGNSRIQLADNWIKWDKWRFHLRIDPRTGPVISQASIADGDRQRSVLYQGSISELFVPYMDPTSLWYFRTYLDVGEYAIGMSGVPLRQGIDCPANGQMVDSAFLNERGKVYTKEGIACIFERETADASWSHFEMNGGSVTRRHTELVVRFIVWLGNYDYVLDWIFTETGSIRGRVGATGVVQVRGVESQTMQAASATTDTQFGRLIAPGTVAVNHDHFFNFRLDLDIDGTANRMLLDKIRRVDLSERDFNTPRRQIWQLFPEQLTREADAQLSIDTRQPALWRVSHPAQKNRVGNPTSYQLRAGVTGRTLLGEAEIAHRRASFTDHHLWVTPYRRDERFAAGDYPNQHPGGAGLPAWTRENRSIEDTDIVLWYTMGMHHVVRAEDWPVMPTVHSEFELRPFDFFDFNPTVAE
jgi:primary-amine oxidase